MTKSQRNIVVNDIYTAFVCIDNTFLCGKASTRHITEFDQANETQRKFYINWDEQQNIQVNFVGTLHIWVNIHFRIEVAPIQVWICYLQKWQHNIHNNFLSNNEYKILCRKLKIGSSEYMCLDPHQKLTAGSIDNILWSNQIDDESVWMAAMQLTALLFMRFI